VSNNVSVHWTLCQVCLFSHCSSPNTHTHARAPYTNMAAPPIHHPPHASEPLNREKAEEGEAEIATGANACTGKSTMVLPCTEDDGSKASTGQGYTETRGRYKAGALHGRWERGRRTCGQGHSGTRRTYRARAHQGRWERDKRTYGQEYTETPRSYESRAHQRTMGARQTHEREE
jgi:hypothetical protein